MIYLGTPPGWTRADGKDEIVVEGPVPDTDRTRSAVVRVTLHINAEGHLKRTGRLKVSLQRLVGLDYDLSARDFRKKVWRRRGYGGIRLTDTLLRIVASGGSDYL